MEIDERIKIVTFDGVYEPAEDTYLLIKSIDIEPWYKKALDMGCGTGIIALHLAKFLSTTAVDINIRAVENTKYNAKMNKMDIMAFVSNLFEKVNGKFDIIAFNPPYLPTHGEDIAWDGGEGGIEIMEKFLHDAWKYLEEKGKIYFVLSSLSDIKSLMKKFPQYEFKKKEEASFFFEKIYSYVATVAEPSEDRRKNH